MKRLWDKGAALDERVHRFTVGDDPALDLHVLPWDCLASAAHVRTLLRAGLLEPAHATALLAGLREIHRLALAGKFEIPPEQEDGHTAIEMYLTKRWPEAGPRIHTGRSRNDQIATAMRLFMRHHSLGWMESLGAFVEAIIRRWHKDGDLPMPGYSHLQRAMPSSTGQWLHAHAEAALEQMRAGLDLLDRLDACPLGTGAGYGVPLPLEREYSAGLLGFRRVQQSPIDVQNSRGRMETYFVRVAADIGGLLEKLGGDLVLWATREFGFVRLPESLTTGSSIMPQKRNPDVLELLRARGAALRGRLAELDAVRCKLTSGYHRDLQLTKGPTIRSAFEAAALLEIAVIAIGGLQWDSDRMARAMSPELFATQEALDLVRRGIPFREAYRRVAENLKSAAPSGSPQSAQIDTTDQRRLVEAEFAELQERAVTWRSHVQACEAAVLEE